MAQPGPPSGAMHPGGMAPMAPMGYQNPMQQQPQQQQQQQQQQQPQRTEDKLITKCKELMGPLKEKWSMTLREAALKINANTVSADAKMPAEHQQGKFESHLEDFYATLDQIEVNLRSAIDCQSQVSSSHRAMPIVPQPRVTIVDHPGPKDFLTYPEYIATSKQQVAFANEMRQLLNRAAKDVVEQNYAVPQQQPQPPSQAQPTPAQGGPNAGSN